MIRLMLSAFQSIVPAELNVSQIMSPSENFLKDALITYVVEVISSLGATRGVTRTVTCELDACVARSGSNAAAAAAAGHQIAEKLFSDHDIPICWILWSISLSS